MNDADPRVKRTRKLIQDAFAELMTEKSFHAITVQDVAEKATINRATFYAHFTDKYALLEQSIGEWFREAVTKRLSSAAPFTLNNLYALIVAVMQAFGEFQRHCKPTDRTLDPLVESRVQRELEAFLLAWLRTVPRVEPGSPLTRETAATVLSWAIFGAAIEWSRGTNRLSVDELAHQVLSLIADGIASWTAAGRAPVGNPGEPVAAGRR